jgi:hypothetical protein
MKWFGHKYDAPAWEDMEQSDVPVGQDCTICHAEFTENDDGLLTPGFFGPYRNWHPYHVLCFIGSILGPNVQLPARVEGEETNDVT